MPGESRRTRHRASRAIPPARPVRGVTSASRASATRKQKQNAEHRIRQQVLRLVPECPGQLVARHRRGKEDERPCTTTAGRPEQQARQGMEDRGWKGLTAAADTSASRAPRPSRRIRRTSCPPVRICWRGSSRISTANTIDTRNAKSTSSRKWLVTCAPFAMSKASRIDEKVQQAGDDEKAVAVLVGRGRDLAGAGAHIAREDPRHAEPDVGNRRQCHERIGKLEREDAAAAAPGRSTNIRLRTTRKTAPFCRRPSQKCAAPGMAQASTQTSVSVPGSADCASSLGGRGLGRHLQYVIR